MGFDLSQQLPFTKITQTNILQTISQTHLLVYFDKVQLTFQYVIISLTILIFILAPNIYNIRLVQIIILENQHNQGTMFKQIVCLLIFFKEVNFTLDVPINIGVALTGPIFSISAGENHITISSYPNSDYAKLTFDVYNVAGSITNLGLVTYNSYKGINQKKGANTLTSNSYILEGPSGLKADQNFTIIKKTWNNPSYTKHMSTFGNDTQTYFQLIEASSSCSLFLTSPNLIAVPLKLNAGHECFALRYSSTQRKIFTLSQNTITYQLLFETFDQSISFGISNSIIYQNALIYANSNLDVSAQFICIGYGDYLQVTDLSMAIVCSITLTGWFVDFKITDLWVYVSLLSQVKQFHISSCMEFGTTPTYIGTKITILEPTITSPQARIFLWTWNGNWLTMVNSNDRYRCSGGCLSCITNYTLDSQSQCYFPTIIPPSPSPQQLQQPTQAVASERNTCNKNCNSCSIQSDDICIECSVNRIIDINTGNCSPNFSIRIIIIISNILNTFRAKRLQFLYFLFDNIEIYKFHSKDYKGVTNKVLDQIEFYQNQKWKLLPIQPITSWINQPYLELRYINHTEAHFVKIQRRDAQLFQTTKAYYVCFIPGSLFIFFILNRMFYLFRNHKISQFLRIYSFWLEYVFIIVVSNSTMIIFLFFEYTKLLFSFSSVFSFLNGISVAFFGLYIIVLLSIFFMSFYFYGTLSKYFLTNLYRIRYAYALASLCYSMRPLGQAAIHSFLFNNNFYQLIILILFDSVFVILSLCLELKFSIYKQKVILMSQICLGSCSILLNLFLIGKFHISNQDGQNNEMYNLFQQLLINLFNIKCLIILLSCLYGVIKILQIIKKGQKEQKTVSKKDSEQTKKQQETIWKKKQKEIKSKQIYKLKLKQCEEDVKINNLLDDRENKRRKFNGGVKKQILKKKYFIPN